VLVYVISDTLQGLPFHMNLAVGGAVRPHVDRATHATELREKDTTIGRLKSQNRMLTQVCCTPFMGVRL